MLYLTELENWKTLEERPDSGRNRHPHCDRRNGSTEKSIEKKKERILPMKKNYDTPTIYRAAVVAGHPNYIVYEDGRIFSIKSAKFLKPTDHGTGHIQVYLDGEKFYVHRLVAETFVPNPNEFDTVHHLDENPSNNRANNLVWVSHADHQRIHCSKPVMRLSDGAIFPSGVAASRALGMCDCAVSTAICREIRCAGSYWQYVKDDDREIFED